MRLLLDEDVPIPFVAPLRRLAAAGHEVKHVEELGWKGKKDIALYRDAKQRGFDAVLTNDESQLDNPDECKAIKRSGLHHIRYKQETRRGRGGLAYAMAAVFAAFPDVMTDLESADGQRLVLITSLSRRRRHEMTDPATDPPRYWPH